MRLVFCGCVKRVKLKPLSETAKFTLVEKMQFDDMSVAWLSLTETTNDGGVG